MYKLFCLLFFKINILNGWVKLEKDGRLIDGYFNKGDNIYGYID